MLRSLWLSQVEDAATIKPKCFSLHWIIILEKDWQEVCGPLSLLSKHNHILCLAAETAVYKPCHSAPWSLGLPSWTWFLESSHTFADCRGPVWPVGCYHPPTADADSVTRFVLIVLPQPTYCSHHLSIPQLIRQPPVSGSCASGPKKLICTHHS